MEEIKSFVPQGWKLLAPYSPATKVGSTVYASGTVSLDPGSGDSFEGDIATQTIRTLENLEAELKASGTDRTRLVKTTVYLTDMATFEGMNKAYGEFFGDSLPSRTTIGVKELARPELLIEIDGIAVL